MGSCSATTSGSLCLPSLLCEEDESCFSGYDPRDEILSHCCIDESDRGFFEELIDREANDLSQSDEDASYFLVNIKETLSVSAWLDAVEWILNVLANFYTHSTRTSFGFHEKTAYLSVLYLDRFLSKRSISGFKEFLDRGQSWSVRLLSVACLSLAAKMEEYNAPAVSEYYRVCADEYKFQVGVVQRMELLVLKTLEWRMNLITPFDYFGYFIHKICGESEPKGLATRAIELALATLKDVNFLGHPSSVIAAAAILAAYDYQLTRKLLELKIDVISSSWGSPHKKLVVEAKWDILNLPLKQSNSDSETSNCLENSQIVLSSVGHKRRLMNSDCDPPREKIR